MLYVLITVFADVAGIALLERAQGFERPWYLLAGIATMAIGFVAFSFATKTMPMAVANTVWSGLSIVLVVAVGRVMLNQHLSLIQYGFVLLILIGAVGLQAMNRTTL